jgi:hypothetical protein
MMADNVSCTHARISAAATDVTQKNIAAREAAERANYSKSEFLAHLFPAIRSV